ncbi:hypothetical protein [Xanthomonas arboricola]|uniref:hypothetical protein n=1 Tax=Xanthomonas arboricola TaxID=56448 RepID=UPI000A589857|nr:hypothetical protein [Xanthomonas arboricola]
MTSQEGSSNSNNGSGNNNGGGDSKPADPFGFEDANKLGSAYRSATFAFVAQYEKQYAQSLADGLQTEVLLKIGGTSMSVYGAI